MCRLSRNLGASTSWNPKGLSRPVIGLLYLTRVLLDLVLSSAPCSVKMFRNVGTFKYYTVQKPIFRPVSAGKTWNFGVICFYFFILVGTVFPFRNRRCSLAFPRRFLYQNAVCITCFLSATCPSIRNLRTFTFLTTLCGRFEVHTAVLLKSKCSVTSTPQNIPESSILTQIICLLLRAWARFHLARGQGPVVGPCECGGAPSSSIKFWLRFSFWFVGELLSSQEGICSFGGFVFEPLSICVAAMKRVTTQSSSLLSDLHGYAVMIVQSIIGCVWTAV
jgi:hypothetical protein